MSHIDWFVTAVYCSLLATMIELYSSISNLLGKFHWQEHLFVAICGSNTVADYFRH